MYQNLPAFPKFAPPKKKNEVPKKTKYCATRGNKEIYNKTKVEAVDGYCDRTDQSE